MGSVHGDSGNQDPAAVVNRHYADTVLYARFLLGIDFYLYDSYNIVLMQSMTVKYI